MLVIVLSQCKESNVATLTTIILCITTNSPDLGIKYGGQCTKTKLMGFDNKAMMFY